MHDHHVIILEEFPLSSVHASSFLSTYTHVHIHADCDEVEVPEMSESPIIISKTSSSEYTNTGISVSQSVHIGVAPGGNSGNTEGDRFSLDTKSTYILAAVGIVAVVVVAVAVLLTAVCVRKSRQRRRMNKLRRNSTTRTSSASEFVYNSAYEWTCRQSRLLGQVQPGTTSYQSHWSLIRRTPSQRETHIYEDCDAARRSASAAGAIVIGNLARNGLGSQEEVVCHVHSKDHKAQVEIEGENSYSETETGENSQNGRESEIGDGQLANASARSTSRTSLESQRATAKIKSPTPTHWKLPNIRHTVQQQQQQQQQQKEQEEQGYEEIYDTPTTYQKSSADGDKDEHPGHMFSNPIYAKKKEKERKWGRGKGRGRGEKEEEGSQHEGERVSKASTVYYSTPFKPISPFLISDNEAYDSGNSSAVSTEISINISTDQKPSPTTCRTAQDEDTTITATHREGGTVESRSFEFANNVAYNSIERDRDFLQ